MRRENVLDITKFEPRPDIRPRTPLRTRSGCGSSFIDRHAVRWAFSLNVCCSLRFAAPRLTQNLAVTYVERTSKSSAQLHSGS